MPFGATESSSDSTLLPAILRQVAISSASVRVWVSTWAMAAIEAKASPLKPLEVKENRSSAIFIFEVA